MNDKEFTDRVLALVDETEKKPIWDVLKSIQNLDSEIKFTFLVTVIHRLLNESNIKALDGISILELLKSMAMSNLLSTAEPMLRAIPSTQYR
jgi:tRNA G26 N,N-dimethylase Trm1